MGRVRCRLRDGIGLAVVSRIPVERYEAEENRALCWLLSQLLERPVAQAWNGAMLYDVRDTGRALEYGVRRSITNLDLTFHTDGPWLDVPPHFVGLYCVNPAQEGGVSRFVSFGTVHNEIRRRHPRLLPRLYRPFPWDRQAEHAPEDAKAGAQPVFQYDGRALVGRFNERLIETGAELAGAPLDAEGRDALEVMRERRGLARPLGGVHDRAGADPVPQQSRLRAQPDRLPRCPGTGAEAAHDPSLDARGGAPHLLSVIVRIGIALALILGGAGLWSVDALPAP